MRFPEWPELMDDYINANNHKQYRYGVFDCVTFCAGLIKIISNINILEGVEYKDARSALRVLKSDTGLFDMTGKQMITFGMREIPTGLTRRGDIVGFMTDAHGETVGVCVGSKFVSPGENDLIFLPMTEAVKAWGIK